MIRSRADLVKAIGAPPLAVIPAIVTHSETIQRQRMQWVFAVAIAAGIATFLLLFHVFFKPLDVTWFMAMRKLGWM